MSVKWVRQKSDSSLQRTDEEKQRSSKCGLALKKSGYERKVRGQTVARRGAGSRSFLHGGARSTKGIPEHINGTRNSWERRGGTHVKKEGDGWMEDHRKPNRRGDTFQSTVEGSALGRGKDRSSEEGEEKQERQR